MLRYFSLWTLLTLLVMFVHAVDAQAAGECFASNKSYWTGFRNYWLSFVKNQNNMILAVIGFGAMCIFIVTRGKWKK